MKGGKDWRIVLESKMHQKYNWLQDGCIQNIYVKTEKGNFRNE